METYKIIHPKTTNQTPDNNGLPWGQYLTQNSGKNWHILIGSFHFEPIKSGFKTQINDTGLVPGSSDRVKPPLKVVHHNRLSEILPLGFRRSITLTVKTKTTRSAPKLVPAAPKGECRKMWRQPGVGSIGRNFVNSSQSTKTSINIASMIIIIYKRTIHDISQMIYKSVLKFRAILANITGSTSLKEALHREAKSYPQLALPTDVQYVIMRLLSESAQKQMQNKICVREVEPSAGNNRQKTKQKNIMRRQLLAKLSGYKQSWATTRARGRYLWLRFNFKPGYKTIPLLSILGLYLSVMLISPVILAGSLSEGFPTADNYPNGTLVSIRNTVPTTVELANTNNSDYLLGTIEPEGDSLLTIRGSGSTAYVATSGDVQAFISDVNGEVEKGDFVGTSWISGIGMKADKDSQQKLLGIALQSFSEVADNAVKFANIETPTGKVSAKVGKIAIRLFDREVGPALNQQNSALENFASKITGREVAFARIFAALALFVVSLIISGVFLSNAIRGSFISLGRNPLASSSIFASLMQVSGVSISLVLIGALIAYLVLIL